MTARIACLVCLIVAVAAPEAAQAHALLERTVPERGAALDSPPREVAFYFNEPVEASFGAIRVYDSVGDAVETGELTRPEDRSDAVGVPIEGELGDGTYTATYRVVSADSHPVSGGVVFSVGRAGAAPAESVSELLDDSDAGGITSVAYWAARWIGYVAIGVAIGALGFIAVWGVAMRRSRGEREWREAAAALGTRMRALLLGAALAGIAASAAAVVLQGATAGGTSFWSALDSGVVSDVLDTRFGLLTGLRIVAWALLASVVVGTGFPPVARGRPIALAALGVAAAFLVASPALVGHAATQEPTWVLLPADIVHVTAMSLWLGGLVALVVALPAATAVLERPERSRLLAAVLLVFSPLALACVVALVVGGTIQAIVYVGPLSDFVETAFGRAVLIKIALLLGLIGLGALNRRRSLPALREIAERREPPGHPGRVLRRTVQAEVALIVVVLGVAAALVSYPPPSQANAGPASGSEPLGDATLEYTVDPAEPGRNELHLYLFDADDGTQFTAAREISVVLELPAKQIGPIEVELRRAGPGHYVAQSAPFGVSGDWLVDVAMRTSRFQQDETEFEVPIG